MRLLQRAHKETTLRQHKNRRKAEVDRNAFSLSSKSRTKPALVLTWRERGWATAQKKETKQENKKKGKTKKRE